MNVHDLKILPEYYNEVLCGNKRFEIRKNDRGFHCGDLLHLKEWDGDQFTGNELYAIVRYVLYGTGEYGLSEDYCIMSIDIPVENKIEDVISEYCTISCDLCNRFFNKNGDCPSEIDQCSGTNHWKLLIERIKHEKV